MEDIQILKEIMRLEFQMDDITDKFYKDNDINNNDIPTDERLRKLMEFRPTLEPLKKRREELKLQFIQ